MRRIAVFNQKGGVGKTTTTQNLGFALGRKGKSVLLVDLDPQANLTESCGLDPGVERLTIHDVLIAGSPVKKAVVELQYGIHLLPSCQSLAAAEIQILERTDRDTMLKRVLSRIEGYDVVLIDCPPALGQLSVNALKAANEVLIPVEGYFALRGLRNLLETIAAVTPEGAKHSHVVITRHDNTRVGRLLFEKLEEYLGGSLCKTGIRKNVALVEAPMLGQDIFTYDARSHGAADYDALCNELFA